MIIARNQYYGDYKSVIGKEWKSIDKDRFLTGMLQTFQDKTVQGKATYDRRNFYRVECRNI